MIGADTIGVGAIGVGAIGVGAIGVGAIGVGAIGVGAIGVGAIGVGAIGVGAIGVGATWCKEAGLVWNWLAQAKISVTTRAGSTPVSFWSRPWNGKFSFSWSMPNWCSSVACKSRTATGFSATL